MKIVLGVLIYVAVVIGTYSILTVGKRYDEAMQVEYEKLKGDN